MLVEDGGNVEPKGTWHTFQGGKANNNLQRKTVSLFFCVNLYHLISPARERTCVYEEIAKPPGDGIFMCRSSSEAPRKSWHFLECLFEMLDVGKSMQITKLGPAYRQGSRKVIITNVIGASLAIFLTLCQRWWQITLNIKGGLPRIQIVRVVFIDDLMCGQGKVQRFLVCNWIAINNSSLSCLNFFVLHRPRQPRDVPREIAFLKLPQAVVFFTKRGGVVSPPQMHVAGDESRFPGYTRTYTRIYDVYMILSYRNMP